VSGLLAKALLLLFVSFTPPLIYLVWIRNTEIYEREPWRAVLKVFIWGAFIATITAAFIEILLLIAANQAIVLQREYEYLARNKSFMALLLVCAIAPLAEEFTKGLGVFIARRYIDEVEDGLVYGASSGLGFAAMENLLYDLSAMSAGLIVFVFTSVLRAISSALLHASATAVTGYGISRKIVYGPRYHIIPFYFLAVLMHATFNFMASLYLIFGGTVPVLGILVAVIFAIFSIKAVRRKIIRLDRGMR